MRYLLSVVIAAAAFTLTNCSYAQERTYDEAYTLAKKLNKKVMVIFTMPNCPPCLMLKQALKTDAEVIFVSRNYEIVTHKFTSRDSLPPKLRTVFDDMKVTRFPRTISIDPQTREYRPGVIGFNRSDWLNYFR